MKWSMLLILAAAWTAAGRPQLQIGVDSSRPLSIYQAPSTGRRDPRGQLYSSFIIRAPRPGELRSQAPGSTEELRPVALSGAPSAQPSTAGSSPGGENGNRGGRAQNLKPLVVTSRPFGFGSDYWNEIRKQRPTSTTTTTTTTTTVAPPTTSTEAPFHEGSAPVTIPFFSISCTVGSSCSQIIAARQIKTPKPTFKPYTREEINKFKGPLSSLFPPNGTQLSRRTTTKPPTTTTAKSSTSAPWSTTTTAEPRWTTPSTTEKITSTTRRPWPVYIRSTTTTAATTRRPTTKLPDLWPWKWPIASALTTTTERSIDRNQLFDVATTKVTDATGLSTWTLAPQWNPTTAATTTTPAPTTTTSTTTTSTTTARPKTSGSAYQGHWLSLLSATLNSFQKVSGSKPVKTHEPIRRPLPLPSPPTPEPFRRPLVKQQPSTQEPIRGSLSQQLQPTPEPFRRPLPPPSPPPSPEPVRKPQPQQSLPAWNWVDADANSLVWSDESIRNPQPNVNLHEVVSTKGNKLSLITGAKRPIQATPAPSTRPVFQLPPEVSISSQVIGLNVKPRSLSFPTHVERVQGVPIETDGSNVNLSHLINRQQLPRPARYLTSIITPWGYGYPSNMAPPRK